MEQSEDAFNLELERKYLELRDEYAIKKDRAKQEIQSGVKDLEQQVADYEKTIYGKDLELASLEGLEQNALIGIGEKADERIKTEEAKIESSRKILAETVEVDVEPLEEHSKLLTARIEKGRGMPTELLKIAALPIPGISVDGEGQIRIGKTLIDGLSEGEQLELAFRVAKAQAGELKLICNDERKHLNKGEFFKWHGSNQIKSSQDILRRLRQRES